MSEGSERIRIVRIGLITGGILLVLALLLVLMLKMLNSHESRHVARFPAHDYQYMEREAASGFKLHVLQTDPSNISLEVVRQNLALSDYYGVNGGFFYDTSLVSMAIVNGQPVGGAKGQYGTGDENTKYARGTLVWDGASNKLSVQIVSKSSELKVSDPLHYWAQGGISMSLGQDELWYGRAVLENAPLMDNDHLRSAAVYDRQGKLYLIVSSTSGTLADFRAAILDQLGSLQLVDGIFLDGDGSSQMQAAEKVLKGDSRPVVEMIRIVK
ncbi:phosphodiester glycosidase family protein [Paenibacillus albus]|uniref:Phosphodiester glycosidase domain-containing protein n=1 Tax=Paenibacillus albus TaxID=2495582 RepID=A0A3S9A5Q7_9BACL|nr:phosphodiester glycosidase family protein [Paenibacillus albus]AZN41087.1 hypothetical protein EJC50_16485 [Paenibacillus albus]